MRDASAALRAELDQTPEWWDSQYRQLVRRQIPRDLASHEGHSIVEEHTYAGTIIYRACTDCGVGLSTSDDPRQHCPSGGPHSP